MCENGAVIYCPGLFDGELLITTDTARSSLIMAMNARDPAIEYITEVFTDLVQTHFTHCIMKKKRGVALFSLDH